MGTARGQITIVDLNDAKTVNVYLSSNHPITQIFNQDGQTYIPNWNGGSGGTDLVITPELLISGVSGTPKFQPTPVWKINGTTVVSGTAISGITPTIGAAASNYQLTLRGNMVDVEILEVEVSGNYLDTDMGVNIPVKANITFHKSVNTGQLCMARIDATGHVFKEEATGPTPSSITLEATLIRGSDSDVTPSDSTPFTVQWQKRVSSGEDTDGTVDGWLTLQSGKYYFTDGTSATSDNTAKKKMYHVNGRTLVVYPDGVDSEDTFKAVITDTYSQSATYNKKFPATFTIVDMTDPFSLVVTSDNGTTFKNGTVSTTIRAKLQQGGVDVASGTYNVSYAWEKYNANGAIDTTFNVGNVDHFTISSSDITSKATFFCTCSIS